MPSRKRNSKGSRRRQQESACTGNHLEVSRGRTDHAIATGRNAERPPASRDVNGPNHVTRDDADSQNSDNLLDVSSGSDSHHHCAGESNEYHETRGNGAPGDSGPSPSEEDSGFTSCSEENQDQGTLALRKAGIELKHERPEDKLPLPRRPGFGQLGRRIKLITNSYPLKVPEGDVYHYDVEVVRWPRRDDSDEPGKHDKYRCLKTKEKRRVVQWMVERDGVFEDIYPAYDGEKNLFTRRPIITTFPHVFTTGDRDEIRARVQVKPVMKEDTMSCAINLNVIHSYYDGQSDSLPAIAVTALETILRHGPCLRLVPIGRSFFSPPGPGAQNPLAGGLEIWYGYHQSVRISQWSPTVNLDISATTFFPSGPLLKYMAGFLDTTLDELRYMPIMADRDRNRLNRKLRGRRIETTHTHMRRKYTIIELERDNAHTLRLSENGPSVAQYYKERYNIDLRYSNLPCLRVKPEEKKVYLPVELCNLVAGQHYNHELTQQQKSEMIKFTSCDPKRRFQEIKKTLNFSAERCVREFEIEVSNDPLSVEGRVLDPPSIIYRDDKKVRPLDSAWNMRGNLFFNGAKINSWALIAFRSIRRGLLEKFGRLVKETGQKLGVDIKEPNCIEFVNGHGVRGLLEEMKQNKKIDIAVVVIPESSVSPGRPPVDGDAVYRDIKTSAETVLGLNTQCIRERNVLRVTEPGSRCAAQLLSNLFLKINSKMEGVNYTLVLSEIPKLLWRPVIVMGADVNHPGAYRGLKESLASVSGSLDARGSKYAVRTMPQRYQPQKNVEGEPQKKVEADKKSIDIIQDLKSMTADLLRAFYRHTGRKKPEKIIFYRDGVSEGEFLKIRNHEVRSIREACEELDKDYKPGITFIVVQKRHHVRFMTEDTKLNAPPGTVIDTGVTHPENFDFFLSSQKSFKGTAKPAHYTVLADDNEFTADDLQKLTHQLCYCNVRCTKGVSIPAPVLYAHLAAYRARQYLDATRGDGGSSSGSSDGQWQRNLNSMNDLENCPKVVEKMKNRMYFV